MYLYYDKVLELNNCSDDTARELGIEELSTAKVALMKYHKISEEGIQLRESISNKTLNGALGTFQKFHVVKGNVLVEILDFFWAYNGTYLHAYSTHPDI